MQQIETWQDYFGVLGHTYSTTVHPVLACIWIGAGKDTAMTRRKPKNLDHAVEASCVDVRYYCEYSENYVDPNLPKQFTLKNPIVYRATSRVKRRLWPAVGALSMEVV